MLAATDRARPGPRLSVARLASLARRQGGVRAREEPFHHFTKDFPSRHAPAGRGPLGPPLARWAPWGNAVVVADRGDLATAAPAGGPDPSGARGGSGPIARWGRASYRAQLLAITVVGAALRLILLGSLPLTRDEAFTAIAVQRPLGQMLSTVAHDSAPPLSYLIQHGLIQFWDSPTMLRLPSAAAGVAAILLAAALGRRVGGDRAGLWAAAAMALLPSSVLEARDARMYALATALVLASVLTLWRAVEAPSWRRVLLYGLVVVAALYTNYFVVFAIAAQLGAAAWIFRAQLRSLLRPVLAAGAACVLLTPWLIAARSQFQHASPGFWVQPVGLPSLSGVAVQFFSGPPIDPGVPGQLALEVLQGFVVVAGLVALAGLVARRRSLSPGGRRAAAFLAGSVGIGLALLVVISVWHPLVDARYVSVMWGPFVVLLGIGLALVPRRTWRAAAVLVLAVGSAVLAVAPTKPDTPSLVAHLDGRVGPHDLVWTAPGEYLLIVHYGAAPVVARTRVVSKNLPWYWGTAAFLPGAVVPHVPADVLRHGGRIFYVDEPQLSGPPPPRGYRAAGPRQCFDTICLRVYAERGSGPPPR